MLGESYTRFIGKSACGLGGPALFRPAERDHRKSGRLLAAYQFRSGV